MRVVLNRRFAPPWVPARRSGWALRACRGIPEEHVVRLAEAELETWAGAANSFHRAGTTRHRFGAAAWRLEFLGPEWGEIRGVHW